MCRSFDLNSDLLKIDARFIIFIHHSQHNTVGEVVCQALCSRAGIYKICGMDFLYETWLRDEERAWKHPIKCAVDPAEGADPGIPLLL